MMPLSIVTVLVWEVNDCLSASEHVGKAHPEFLPDPEEEGQSW